MKWIVGAVLAFISSLLFAEAGGNPTISVLDFKASDIQTDEVEVLTRPVSWEKKSSRISDRQREGAEHNFHHGNLGVC